MLPNREQNIHRVFVVSIWLKALNALVEIVLGILLLFTQTLTGLVSTLVASELIEDPTDFIATRVSHFLPYLSVRGELFAAFYLLSHGVIKIFLVWGLLKNKLWAYPASLIFLVLFILYQLVRFTYTPSPLLIALTIFDLVVCWLVWHEYNLLKQTRHEL